MTGNHRLASHLYNAIVEVSGSIPLGSTNRTGARRRCDGPLMLLRAADAFAEAKTAAAVVSFEGNALAYLYPKGHIRCPA